MWLETGIESNISVPPIENFIDDSLNDDLEVWNSILNHRVQLQTH